MIQLSVALSFLLFGGLSFNASSFLGLVCARCEIYSSGFLTDLLQLCYALGCNHKGVLEIKSFSCQPAVKR